MKLSHPVFLTFQHSPSQEPTLVVQFLSGYIPKRDAALRTKGVYTHSTQSYPACWPLSRSTNHFHIKFQSPVCIPHPVFSLWSPEAANLTPTPSAYQITLHATCTKKARFLYCQHLQIPSGSYHLLPFSSPRESTVLPTHEKH